MPFKLFTALIVKLAGIAVATQILFGLKTNICDFQ